MDFEIYLYALYLLVKKTVFNNRTMEKLQEFCNHFSCLASNVDQGVYACIEHNKIDILFTFVFTHKKPFW